MNNRKSYFYLLISILGLLIIVNSSRLYTSKEGKKQLSKQYYQKCNVGNGCRLDDGEASIIFRVLPASLPVLHPLQLEVVLKGIGAEGVTVEFIGRDMPMGLMPVPLERQLNAVLVERFKGVGSISFCTADNSMIWVARLLIKTKSGIIRVDFELQ